MNDVTSAIVNNLYYRDPDLAVDPDHRNLGFFTETLTKEVWNDKYRWENETGIEDMAIRVAKAIYINDTEAHRDAAAQAIAAGLWMPAGRILAGAGTSKVVTLMNCYVTGTIEDSMQGIFRELTNFALTMQQGGGDGADFSTIRPKGAWLTRTQSPASGPLPFMDTWDAMCYTIKSAGARRGAMMGTICDTHPDLLDFVKAKAKAGRLTNFNVSVLISDAFMEAVREDEEWLLYFKVAPLVRTPELVERDFVDDDGVKQYVYAVWQARELFETITRFTYEYSEPGLIFIDRINDLNNLHYVEDIRCTNPCGEQPLPPHGTCNLGAVNLARMVRKPFSETASFNWPLLRNIVRLGVRFLDNVIDVTGYPLPEQQAEELSKRRIGLGFTGLADAMAQLRVRYGSPKSAELAEQIQQCIALTAYEASIELAQERGSFPLFDAEQYLAPNTFAYNRMPLHIKEGIRKHGIRNGVLLTVAPTGTTSLVFGNMGSGVEPFFSLFQGRKVLQPDNTHKQYREWVYSARLYAMVSGQSIDQIEFPAYMVEANELTVDEHILIQGAVQRWVDASVSKTINCPTEMTYEDFVRVYSSAYSAGCKGTTTYRPSAVRGSVLTAGNATETPASTGNAVLPAPVVKADRPGVLKGATYKIKWPRRSSALYLTLNADENGRPFEVFITSKDGTNAEWITALTIMITAIFRQGGDFSFIPRELAQIQSLNDGAWMDKKYYGSLPAYLGHIIEGHLQLDAGTVKVEPVTNSEAPVAADQRPKGETCPQCSAPALTMQEGCKKCTNCGYSSCG